VDHTNTFQDPSSIWHKWGMTKLQLPKAKA